MLSTLRPRSAACGLLDLLSERLDERGQVQQALPAAKTQALAETIGI